MQPNQIDLNPQQVQMAANAGLTLLNTPGAVSVPGPMAVTGVVATLNSLLQAIVSGKVVVMNAPTPKEIAPIPPGGEGDGEKKPDLKPIEGGKKKEG